MGRGRVCVGDLFLPKMHCVLGHLRLINAHSVRKLWFLLKHQGHCHLVYFEIHVLPIDCWRFPGLSWFIDTFIFPQLSR